MARVASHLAAVAVVFVFLMISAMVWFPSPPARDELKDAARQHAVHNCAAALRLDEQYFSTVGHVVEADCRCGRDTNDWVMVRVQPDEVSRIRRMVVTKAYRAPNPSIRQLSYVKSDGDLLTYYKDSRPLWWTPTKLPDAEIVVIGEIEGTVYVFSEETGTIYVMTWTV